MKRIIFFFLLVLALDSCQKVITIDLNAADPKLVVEGNVSNRPGPYTIKLTRTGNYFDDNTFKPETGARVIISDNAGNRDTLIESAPGNYITSSLNTMIGRTYTLFVSAGGQEYTASAKLNDTVSIDSLSYTFRPPVPSSGQPGYYNITCTFTDPPAPGNYYGLRLYKNSTLKNDIVDNRVISDKLVNGNVQRPKVHHNDIIRFDTARVDLVTFDKSAFDYYSTLKQALNATNPFSSPPANPASNLSNNALGYFGAFSITTKKIVIVN